MTGLGKYHKGRYGRIGVYRVNNAHSGNARKHDTTPESGYSGLQKSKKCRTIWLFLLIFACFIMEAILLVWGSFGMGVLQHMEITTNGLIWHLGVFNYGFGYV